MFRAIFTWANRKEIPATYTYLSMLIGNLKQVNVTSEDLVIIAIDSPKGSWRRDIDFNYKANRKEAREKRTDIDWKFIFNSFSTLKRKLELGTPFHQIEIEKLESDDIIAYAVRYFKDYECIIISTDSDYEQLTYYKNVKLFSPKSKKYKEVKNPEKILLKKIEKEKADNLITPVITTDDYNRRLMIVNLLKLPDSIEKKVEIMLDNLKEKSYNVEDIPFKSIKGRFKQLYDKEAV